MNRYRIFERDGFQCIYCGAKSLDGAELHVDHVIPRSRGGSDKPGNLVTACAQCNMEKHARPLPDDQVAQLLKVLEERNRKAGLPARIATVAIASPEIQIVPRVAAPRGLTQVTKPPEGMKPGELELWYRLAGAIPPLDALLREAQAVTDDKAKPAFCANRVWYDRFKRRLVKMVGWSASFSPDFARTTEAYDVAYDVVYEALPDCRSCWCV